MISLKETHREEKWSIAIERYEKIKGMISEVSSSVIDQSDSTILDGCYAQFEQMENEVDRFLRRRNPQPEDTLSSDNFNEITSSQIEKIRKLLSRQKRGAVNES